MPFIEKTKRKHGDRVDGHWVKDAPGMNVIMTGLYPNRTDCEVSAKMELDITELNKYIKERNEKNPNEIIKFFPYFITAIVRVANERRNLNRFVSHYRIYERDEINISFTAKRQFSDDAKEVVVTYKAKKEDNVVSINKFLNGEYKTIRGEEVASKETLKETDNITQSLDKFGKWPRWLLGLSTKFIRWLDKYGKVPADLRNGDPGFATVLVANLGSIKAPSIYHHLNNYGTNSVLITIGTMYKKELINENGEKEIKDMVDFHIIIDERIADGLYFINSMKLLQKYISHPDTLEIPFENDIKFND